MHAVTHAVGVISVTQACCNTCCKALVLIHTVPGSQQAYVTADTPMKISPSYRCAVIQQLCTAALVAECLPYCSVLPCRTGSQQALCHCNYTYGRMLFMQCSNTNALQHWSRQNSPPLFSFALQDRLTAGVMSLQLHLWTSSLHIVVQ